MRWRKDSDNRENTAFTNKWERKDRHTHFQSERRSCRGCLRLVWTLDTCTSPTPSSHPRSPFVPCHLWHTCQDNYTSNGEVPWSPLPSNLIPLTTVPTGPLLFYSHVCFCSFLFYSYVCFCLYGPFNGISLHKFAQQLSDFSLSFSGLTSAL